MALSNATEPKTSMRSVHGDLALLVLDASKSENLTSYYVSHSVESSSYKNSFDGTGDCREVIASKGDF
ncbi:hypothetical protein IL306_007399 [Fusarium sp. DS 682]|nr:hypothetical protein IL306_007399 [Fusarium sp. DS 682]